MFKYLQQHIIIGLREGETFLYFNCESIDKFEQLNLDDENCIRIPIDENYEILQISGIQFIDLHNNDPSIFSNVLNLYGNNVIHINSIYPLSKDDDDFPYVFKEFECILYSIDDIKDLDPQSFTKNNKKQEQNLEEEK